MPDIRSFVAILAIILICWGLARGCVWALDEHYNAKCHSGELGGEELCPAELAGEDGWEWERKGRPHAD